MATLDALKLTLRQSSLSATENETQPLTDAQYGSSFETLMQSSEWTTYQNFIAPQLSHLLLSRSRISILEIGPGPKSVLEYLPEHVKRRIKRYVAFEPNEEFGTKLEERLISGKQLADLRDPPTVHKTRFTLESGDADTGSSSQKFDIILFCHSMYGMNPKRKFIEKALEMLVDSPAQGLVVVFHRDGCLNLDGLVCHRTASFPAATVSVLDDNETLDRFTLFITGHTMKDAVTDELTRAKWRETCRALGSRKNEHSQRLEFSTPTIMAVFTRNATALSKLKATVPRLVEKETVKSREARVHQPAAIFKPTDIAQVQECVQWALKHDTGLTVIGGGHSGHCLWSGVVAVDMDAFDQINIVTDTSETQSSLLIAGSGCKTEQIIRKSMEAGKTVPLGSRPSVGAGICLQGGIGHLSRIHGLTCDAIVGAVVISVASGDIMCVGKVPEKYQPAGAVRPENEVDLLWVINGAGTNFGIVVSFIFKTYPAPIYSVHNWVVPLKSDRGAEYTIREFNTAIASKLPRKYSADAYLFWDEGQLQLGVNTFEIIPNPSRSSPLTALATPFLPASVTYGEPKHAKMVDGIGLFETEMYMSEMHGGHTGGKTSSFKRCIFLNDVGSEKISKLLVEAVQKRPTPFCYLHLLHGGGAIADVAPEATAFGCRDWDFACVVTGVWPREQDGEKSARDAIQWVYSVVRDLLPLSNGIYGADLGPDPRDAAFAIKAFGPNRSRLARIKESSDPNNVLAYACPLKNSIRDPRLILLITGEHGVGKDYCASAWKSFVSGYTHRERSFVASVVSISDAIKREYASRTAADTDTLLSNKREDRDYKEQHRASLTDYYQEQMKQRPKLPEESFLGAVHSAAGVDVLFITGMRDEAPLATFSHLVPESRVLEIRITASESTQLLRRGVKGDYSEYSIDDKTSRPDLKFANEMYGSTLAHNFAERCLAPLLHEGIEQLGSMVPSIPDFPRPGIEFRHVLDIAQRPEGLTLCTSLLRAHFTGDWNQVGAIACCEAGGFIFASALAVQVKVHLLLIRESGKLPPPTVSTARSPSYVSLSAGGKATKYSIEMNVEKIPRRKPVVLVDDVLATGKTLCAALQLLLKAGVNLEDISVLNVAEFPLHQGRKLLRDEGFGRVNVRSLLVFGGV
ncbi:hypothetical protein BU23DRAFT_541703 [Bimuria novae-zelandiae CBS 107.79]|uniref:FAD-binding PCMH-type domain-containing protein n=1 Tax=Bimuria novae-zelandiae CBS 107.79 TaxID=1447943 RepID=A0A6A5UWG0_9PLEO|nr:hypothetical protein BU23DRAFT_541703 [Bimuria novae-zelandiae CBS 107.79]